MKTFQKEIYISRRNKLKLKLKNGIAIFPGNIEEPYNYKANTYKFRQDSDFSYFFGLNEPGLAGLIDFEEGSEILFGNDLDIEDVIWMGHLPTMTERAASVGITKTLPLEALSATLQKALQQNRPVHFLPQARATNKNWIESLISGKNSKPSNELTLAVIELRSVKGTEEIQEIEKSLDVAYQMHTTAMKMAYPGITEHIIAGEIEGIALKLGNGVSFPIILSQNGEILHNHSHHQTLEKGRLMVIDAGAESELLYASDITRTVPVGGTFSPQQKDIYELVFQANVHVIQNAGPAKLYRQMHLEAAEIIASGLKNLGIMKGNTQDAVAAGAHALFFPHGLGHAMGMDVHDMEGLGENNVGYDNTISRSEQFGLAYLRFAKKPLPNMVLTVEPGIYFIPALIELWGKEKKYIEFINYDKLTSYLNFGGIRIEDDILITDSGCKLMGKPIPKSVAEVEQIMQK